MLIRLHTSKFIAALLATLLVYATAQAAGKSEDDVTTFKLDNGMEVVIIPDHRAPVVTHMVWYRVGSADEAPGKGGIAISLNI